MSVLLCYIPFVYPMEVFNDYWYFLILPLSFGIAVIYKALYLGGLNHFWRHATIMTVQIVLAMVALAILLILFVQYVIPFFPASQ